MYEHHVRVDEGAMGYNARAAARWWGWALGHLVAVRPEFADLGQAAKGGRFDSMEFAFTVAGVQKHLGLTPDGRLGNQTWNAMLSPHPVSTKAVVIAGHAVELQGLDGVEIDTTGHRMEGLSGYSRARKAMRKLVVHWGGLNAQHCKSALIDRGYSTHFLIEPMLRDGKLIVYQSLDLALVAYHAGDFNGDSLGVDICRSPRTTFASRYPDGVIHTNRTGRGDRKFVDLDPEMGKMVSHFIDRLSAQLGIPFGEYPGHRVIPGVAAMAGVFGHHHLSARKWDVCVWSRHIWPSPE